MRMMIFLMDKNKGSTGKVKEISENIHPCTG